MILVFDLGGPLLAYGLLRSAGMSAVAALVISGVLPDSSPATEWIAVTSSDSPSDNGGSSPGRRCASIVLPTPGGPVIIR